MTMSELQQQLEAQKAHLAELTEQKAALEDEAKGLRERKRSLAGPALLDGEAGAKAEVRKVSKRLSEIEGEAELLTYAIGELETRVSATRNLLGEARLRVTASSIVALLEDQARDGEAFEKAMQEAVGALEQIEARIATINANAKRISQDEANRHTTSQLRAFVPRRLGAYFMRRYGAERLIDDQSKPLGELLSAGIERYREMAG